MDFLKFFIRDDVPAVGLTEFRDETEKLVYVPQENCNPYREIFKADYTKNFFLT